MLPCGRRTRSRNYPLANKREAIAGDFLAGRRNLRTEVTILRGSNCWTFHAIDMSPIDLGALRTFRRHAWDEPSNWQLIDILTMSCGICGKSGNKARERIER